MRWIVGCVLLGSFWAATAAQLQAGQGASYPPRYRRASMSQTYVYRNRAGEIRKRQVYPGYSSNFPPPAYLYYGYPHSGDDTGIGFSHFR